jgi:hypothetical protein
MMPNRDGRPITAVGWALVIAFVVLMVFGIAQRPRTPPGGQAPQLPAGPSPSQPTSTATADPAWTRMMNECLHLQSDSEAARCTARVYRDLDRERCHENVWRWIGISETTFGLAEQTPSPARCREVENPRPQPATLVVRQLGYHDQVTSYSINFEDIEACERRARQISNRGDEPLTRLPSALQPIVASCVSH